MKARSRLRARTPRLAVQLLEDRTVPAAALFDADTVVVSFRGAVRTVAVPPGQTVPQAVAGWGYTPGVSLAEPNYRYSVAAVPNDPSFGTQYAQNNTGQSGGTADADIDAVEAWDTTTGGTGVVVAVIDSGVDYTHPDLYRNVWINQDEIPAAVRSGLTDADADGKITFRDLNVAANQGTGKITDLNGNGYIDGGDLLSSSAWENGADNDGNGYVDDLIGWDFANNDNDPFDDNNHGTHVAGTIGAEGDNGVGVAGVAWKTQIMPLKFLGANGSGSLTAAVNAVNYSVTEGAGVSNNSWGGGGYSQSLYNAIDAARAAGQVFVAAAGNANSNNDTTASYPANYALSNVVSVASTDRNDARSSFSNYGAATVDLAAPGSSILSTTPNNTYSTFSGTSMATPQVAGTFVLARTQFPADTAAQSISRVLGAVDPLAALAGITITGGRLNAARAVGTPTTPPPPPPPPPASTTFSNATAKALPDLKTTTSTLAVAQDLTVGKITVKLNVTHTYVSDLVIKLVGPSGTSVQLFNRRGGAGDNLTNTVFDTAATTAVSAGAAPFAGTYRPEAGLTAFNAQNARGTWTLSIQDAARYDVGTLTSWSITITA